MSLADLGISRLFSAHLAARWAELFGDEPVTLDDILSDPDAATYLRRASGADIRAPHTQRSIEHRAFVRWFSHFESHPIPTHDGNNDLILNGNSVSGWRLTRVGRR